MPEIPSKSSDDESAETANQKKGTLYKVNITMITVFTLKSINYFVHSVITTKSFNVYIHQKTDTDVCYVF